MDTIEKIENDLANSNPMRPGTVDPVNIDKRLEIRILIQIAKELRVLAQRSE